ncbi:OmpA family protein [Pontimicrobium sp. IMCC45349]|uniref:OmpA family protein n=1 Tax=Pontimicrobium sp. IMCC45349 TaxID=3391574 RepID=UPI0039A01614
MKTKVLLIILALFSSLSFSQKKLADKFFKNFAYIKASELYENAVKDGDSSQHVLTRLGDCYYNNSNSEKAAVWYEKALKKYPKKVNSEYIFKYIQTQLSLGEYENAQNWLTKFNALQDEDNKLKLEVGDLSIYENLASTDKIYVEIKNLDANTSYSDFGTFIHKDKIYFASTRNTSDAEGKKIYTWNEQPYLDIYQGTIGEKDGEITINGIDFIDAEDINTDYHEASVAITNDGKTIYFTRDNVNKRNKLDYDKKGTSHLKIYKASLNNDSWSEIEELPFNDDVFSTGHPTLSPDNKKMYFVSDRDGGYGQTDIYEVDIDENGNFGTPKNLGASVNTSGREMFPFVAKDSTLYFSSDGYINLGLLDIFKSDVLKNSESTNEPENLGAPFNSGYDDFAYFVNSEDGNGYFSSNRPGGKGNDDIYSFASYECKQIVKGIARNSKTEEPLKEVKVQLIDDSGKIIEEVTTDETGAYTFELECDKTFSILGIKSDYKDDLKEVSSTSENNFEHNVDLHLVPLINDNQIVINPIFFDFDKWDIRTDAQYELENIVNVMRDHPTMVIKIESHTDSRGSDRYNMKLSDRRAKYTRDYLLSRGIEASRIESAIGYGESQLLNECANGVKCSKEQHQLNRRSYFYILKN